MKTNSWSAALRAVVSAVAALTTTVAMTYRGVELFPNQVGASIWDVC